MVYTKYRIVSIGDEFMKTILIYTTKYGSVEKVATMMKSTLDGDVTLVNLMKQNAPNLDAYDTVILGGSIYMGSIQKKMLEYGATHLPTLLKKRIGLFICAASPENDTKFKQLESAFPAELYAHATVKDVLGSEVISARMGFVDRLITKVVMGGKNYSDLPPEKIQKFVASLSA